LYRSPINRRVARGSYARLSYTYARAIDDGQDALVAGQPATVENSYNPRTERGPSVTDQRPRLVAAISAEPHPFHRGQELLGHIFNDWKFSSVVNYGSGRPFNATVAGDPKQDGNDLNDRLPGYSRNAFTGPDYTTPIYASPNSCASGVTGAGCCVYHGDGGLRDAAAGGIEHGAADRSGSVLGGEGCWQQDR
jgi:hypothetical protein